MKVKIKKLHPDAVIPKYAHPGEDAGVDLTAISREYDEENEVYSYKTGLAIQVPKGHVGLIFPRSSIYKSDLSLSNAVGVIDSGYTGEISFKFKMTKDAPVITAYSVGDRIGQLIIMPYPQVEFEEVDELDETERGSSGFGSSGA